MSVVRTTTEKIFHNYPVDMLQAELRATERAFNLERMTVEQCRVNRRICAALNSELARRFGQQGVQSG